MRKAPDSLELEAFSLREIIFLIGEIIQLFIIVGFLLYHDGIINTLSDRLAISDPASFSILVLFLKFPFQS